MSSERDKVRRERMIEFIAEKLGASREAVASRMPDLDGIAVDSLDVAELALLIEEDFDDGTLP